MTDRPPPNQLDNVANLVGSAVGDIRQKLVEEAWFGRALSGENPPTYYELVRAMYGPPSSTTEPKNTKSPSVDLDR